MTKKKTTNKRSRSPKKARASTRKKATPKPKPVTRVINLEEEQRKKEEAAAALQKEARRPFSEVQNQMEVADGKKSDIEKMKDLEDLLGVKQTNPFGTTSLAVLEENMDGMGLSDLQALAVRIGILPSGNKLSLKNKIKRQFKSHPGAGAAYHIGFQKPLVDPGSPEAKKILKILNEDM
tara:strand:+ start:131 stop:667 length:537 start_codon:yes stop_codon:yes gene_type:complete